MVVGREEIREIALGLEMAGLEGWTYPYQKVLIDEQQGEILGLWKQVADATKADGTNYEIAGLGGSWFRYAGNFQWSWQRDFFDVGNAGAVFMAMIKDGTLLPGMQQRMERAMSGERLPGHYRLGEAPVGLWEVPPGAVVGGGKARARRSPPAHRRSAGPSGPSAPGSRRTPRPGDEDSLEGERPGEEPDLRRP